METNREYIRQRYISVDGGQSVGEHTLPDYQGDVKKILYSHAEAESGGRYHSGDNLECVGVVVYKIVYLDSEGKITPVTFTTDYEMSVKCPAEQYVDSYDRTRVANFSLRLMGPRRFSVKAQLECDLYISERKEHTVEGNGASSQLECRTKEVSVATAQYSKTEEREVAEELAMLEGAILDEVEVVIHSAEPRSVSITRNGGEAQIKCQVYVKALIRCEPEEPRTYECMVDVAEALEIGDISDNSALVPRVDIVSETVSLNPTEGGVSAVVSLLIEAGVQEISNTEIELIKDCYSTERGVELEEGDFAYTEFLASRVITEKFGASAEREQIGAENVRNILYESARVKTDNVSITENGVAIAGSIHVSAIACEVTEDGLPSYVPMRFELPFAINVNFGMQIPENAYPNMNISMDSFKIDLDGNNVTCSGTLSGAVSLYAEKREPCIMAVNLSDETYDKNARTVSVYYPLPSESLFDVAKRFHTTALELAKSNELAESVFAAKAQPLISKDVHYLLIGTK